MAIMESILLLILSVSLSAANDFRNATNLFTSDIYKQVAANESGNFLVSPFSAEIVLALVRSGAKGESGEELRRALHLPNDSDLVEKAVQKILPQLRSNNLYSLQSANKLYFQNNFKLNTQFKQKSTEVYRTDSEAVDFRQNVDAVNNINTWVERQTNNKIRNLLEVNDVDELTRAVLVNAVYFKANWLNPFRLTSTQKIAFHKTPIESVQVDALHHSAVYFDYFECPHLQAQFLELPFRDDDASLVVVLPNKTDGLGALEKQLEDVFQPQHSLSAKLLNVVLPKFKIESAIDVKKALENLGVGAIFDASKADLSGVAGNKGDLFVSKVAQKTFISVNEDGVEAAAATDVVIRRGSGPNQPKDFVADHPFIFYIKVKGVIVFAGRVADPKY